MGRSCHTRGRHSCARRSVRRSETSVQRQGACRSHAQRGGHQRLEPSEYRLPDYAGNLSASRQRKTKGGVTTRYGDPKSGSMKLTIFAATGGIGSQLLEQAMRADHYVTAVVRNPKKLPRERPGLRVVTADMANHDPGDGFLMRYLLSPIIKVVLRKVYADHALMEDLLRQSNLDWTIFRPPRLNNKLLSGKYRMALGQNLPGGFSISRADVAQAMLTSLNKPETIRQTVGIAY